MRLAREIASGVSWPNDLPKVRSRHVLGDQEQHSVFRLGELERANHVRVLKSLHALVILGKLVDEVGGGNIPGHHQLQDAHAAIC